ncbi:hypothetical protein F511_28136 [Dorcoceras hygrometricum]|uniref:Uncharacterized protein n=1 Tax=Dorcoceras hygrometricum TaxID=472368 RepID=A0A2Z7BR32_9LAMI|nr:hypothetical protein F511_28136 [Dorcoceras hygrometricum]
MRISFPYVCTPVETASANVYYFSKDSTNLVSLISGSMSDSWFGHRSFPIEYTIEFESTLCLRLKSFLSTNLSLKKMNEQFLAVERFVAVNKIQPFANFSTDDVIISVGNVVAEYDGDVMMSDILLWLTSSNLLKQTMSS